MLVFNISTQNDVANDSRGISAKTGADLIYRYGRKSCCLFAIFRCFEQTSEKSQWDCF